MKYKYGDIVYYKWDPDKDEPISLQILSFSEKYQKYLCVEPADCWQPTGEGMCLDLIAEEDLDYYENINKADAEKCKKWFNAMFPPNLDTRYFNVYDVSKEGERKVRGSVSRRKEGEVPVRK